MLHSPRSNNPTLRAVHAHLQDRQPPLPQLLGCCYACCGAWQGPGCDGFARLHQGVFPLCVEQLLLHLYLLHNHLCNHEDNKNTFLVQVHLLQMLGAITLLTGSACTVPLSWYRQGQGHSWARYATAATRLLSAHAMHTSIMQSHHTKLRPAPAHLADEWYALQRALSCSLPLRQQLAQALSPLHLHGGQAAAARGDAATGDRWTGVVWCGAVLPSHEREWQRLAGLLIRNAAEQSTRRGFTPGCCAGAGVCAQQRSGVKHGRTARGMRRLLSTSIAAALSEPPYCCCCRCCLRCPPPSLQTG